MNPMKLFKSEKDHFFKSFWRLISITVPTYVIHPIVTFCDFLGNFRELSNKNTTKLENSSDRYGFSTI